MSSALLIANCVSVAVAARLTGHSERLVRDLIARGRLTTTTLPGGRRQQVTIISIETYRGFAVRSEELARAERRLAPTRAAARARWHADPESEVEILSGIGTEMHDRRADSVVMYDHLIDHLYAIGVRDLYWRHLPLYRHASVVLTLDTLRESLGQERNAVARVLGYDQRAIKPIRREPH